MKKLYVPRVEDKNSHMRMLRISTIEDLVANSMNILEPSPVDSDQSEREDGKLYNFVSLFFFFSMVNFTHVCLLFFFLFYATLTMIIFNDWIWNEILLCTLYIIS